MDSDHLSISSTEELGSKANQSDQEISWAKSKINPSRFVVLRESDFSRLECGRFLNDNLLEYGFFKLSQSLDSADANRIELFPTFFYERLMSTQNANICRWTKNTNIFDKRIQIYPINEIEHHWYIIVVVFPTNNEPYIAVLDSNTKAGKKEEVVFNIKNYLIGEHQRKSVKSISRNLIEEMETLYPKVPQQQDGSSCGLYALYFVREIFQRVMTDGFNSMFDDMFSWHKNKEYLGTLRYVLAKTIENEGASQGYEYVKLPNLQYFPTSAEDNTFKNSKDIAKYAFFETSISESDAGTDSKIPYQEYLRKKTENQLDYSFVWSYDGFPSDDEKS